MNAEISFMNSWLRAQSDGDSAAIELARIILPAQLMRNSRLRSIRETGERLVADGVVVDEIVLYDALDDKQRSDFVLLDIAPTAANIAYFAQNAAAESMRTSIKHFVAEIAETIDNENTDVLAIAKDCSRKIAEIVQQQGGTTAESLWTLSSNFINESDKIRPVVPAYINAFNQMDVSFGPGEFIVAAARTGVGKTALAIEFALNQSANGHKVAFHSIEMSKSQLVARILARGTSFTVKQLLNGGHGKSACEKMVKAASRLPRDLYIGDRISDIEDLENQIRRERFEYDIDIAYIDYFGLISDRNARKNAPAYERAAEIANRLTWLGKTLCIPIVCIAQLNRETSTPYTRPTLAQLRDTGQLEQNADTALLLYRKSKQEPRRLMVNVAKSRNGPTSHSKDNDVELYFDEPAMTISDWNLRI